ncbi:MAG: hypothetical protein INF91_02320 [Alphaproteobacteria bacterium]|nr:hypothetical protein [Alphaproteobacteria bacterium]
MRFAARPQLRYFRGTREISRREALADWLRHANGESIPGSAARRTFELAEDTGRNRPGEVAMARRALDAAGLTVTGVEGL